MERKSKRHWKEDFDVDTGSEWPDLLRQEEEVK
jgi:hypothetical protein